MNFDFSGVEPLRLHEARRRVAAVEAYNQLKSPTTHDATDAAQSIGLNLAQFRRLVRVWRTYRDASLLVSGPRRRPRGDYGLDPRAEEIIAKAIEEAGDNAELAPVSRAVRCACDHAGVRPPSQATIYKRIKAVRATGVGQIAADPLIIVGRMWFHLPITGRLTGDMPCLLVALTLPERQIIYHEISTNPSHPPCVRNAVRALITNRNQEAPKRRLLLDPYDFDVASAVLDEANLPAVKPHKRSVQRMLTKAMGGKLSSLNAIYRPQNARPHNRKISRQDNPLQENELHKIIELGIEHHNNSLASEVPLYDIDNR